MGRFDKRPGQVAVAVLGVAPALAFAVADPFAPDAAAGGGVGTDVGNTTDRTGPQQNGPPQAVTDPADGKQ